MDDLLIADGHVHAHMFDPEAFLDAASENLRNAGGRMGAGSEACLAYLLLAETEQEDFFQRARSNPSWGDWRTRPTAEPEALLAVGGSGRTLVLVAGRQVSTEGGLEVLATGTLARFPTGLPFPEALDRVLDAAALAIIPWGFGKWWGRRGRLVERELRRPASPALFVGDNGGRLRWTPEPRLMGRARARGIRVLPGSDPLPFPGQADRVGQAGFAIRGRADPDRPLAALVAALRQGTSPQAFRKGERTLAFVGSQVRMQLHKRARRVR